MAKFYSLPDVRFLAVGDESMDAHETAGRNEAQAKPDAPADVRKELEGNLSAPPATISGAPDIGLPVTVSVTPQLL